MYAKEILILMVNFFVHHPDFLNILFPYYGLLT